jgi:hypothetical protein
MMLAFTEGLSVKGNQYIRGYITAVKEESNRVDSLASVDITSRFKGLSILYCLPFQAPYLWTGDCPSED